MPQITTELEVYLLSIFDNINGSIEVDWAGVMADVGFRSIGGTKNKLHYAKTQYAKQKAEGTLPVTVAAAASTTAAAVKPKKTSKRKAEDEVEEEGADTIEAAIKPKATKVAKK